jgi:hypothetical protein
MNFQRYFRAEAELVLQNLYLVCNGGHVLYEFTIDERMTWYCFPFALFSVSGLKELQVSTSFLLRSIDR